MLTRHEVLNRIIAYLNHELTLPELVDWAEDALIEPEIPTSEDADLLMDVLMYLGAADSRGFPLTWEKLSEFVERLGGSLGVSVEIA